ncbi:MAG: transposase, partial [Spirochaetales bacterium]|nr:transposase [Spirochaetales bacterium]
MKTIRFSLSQAHATVDRFHVTKMMGDAVDQIRRREMRSQNQKKI